MNDGLVSTCAPVFIHPAIGDDPARLIEQLTNDMASLQTPVRAHRAADREVSQDLLLDLAAATTRLHAARSQAAHSNHQQLARRRRGGAARGPRARLHHQLAQADLPTIRRNYLPVIVRLIYRHVRQLRIRIAERIAQSEKAKLVARFPDDRAGLKAEIQRRVSRDSNRLTADLVKALYPTWGATITATKVQTTIKNATAVK